jgi:hypothetical protein
MAAWKPSVNPTATLNRRTQPNRMPQASKPSLARFRDFMIFPEWIANSEYEAEVVFRFLSVRTPRYRSAVTPTTHDW